MSAVAHIPAGPSSYEVPSGFMPTELTNHREEGFAFQEAPVSDILQGRYSDLDPECAALLKNSKERMPWRLYIHQPYTVCIQTRPRP